jgi:hypothetical protein
MRARPHFWLLLAVALFAVATWLMWGGESGSRPPRPRRAESDFPRYIRPDEFKREQRRVVPPPPLPQADKPARPRDPLLAALPPETKTAVVFEAAAVRDSPIGKLFIRCRLSREADSLERVKRRFGFDPTKDLDRVAFSDDLQIVTGSFGAADLGALSNESSSRSYGASGTIFDAAPDAAGPRDPAPLFATWGTGMVLIGKNADSVEQAIDRLEGRASPTTPPLSASDAYGEVYGVLGGAQFAELVPDDLQEKFRSAVRRIELHVDTRDSNDVLFVSDVEGPDAHAVDDLGRSLGAAMALGRVQARAEGNDDLLELLDVSRISPHDGRFRVEVALPLSLVERKICRDAGP